jgi:predicted ATP-grasp superfamily ATP-dependent carboligase
MPDNPLKEKLINKIKEIDDPAILEEVSNLFELQEPETIYTTSNEQKKAIDEAQQQIKTNQTLNNDQANKESDEWLKE